MALDDIVPPEHPLAADPHQPEEIETADVNPLIGAQSPTDVPPPVSEGQAPQPQIEPGPQNNTGPSQLTIDQARAELHAGAQEFTRICARALEAGVPVMEIMQVSSTAIRQMGG